MRPQLAADIGESMPNYNIPPDDWRKLGTGPQKPKRRNRKTSNIKKRRRKNRD